LDGLHATAAETIRLGDDERNVVAGFDQPVERRTGER
jgi:hypothetical protein